MQKAEAKPTWIEDELGQIDYYEKRARDFEERNPGQAVPDYYRKYGDKYVRRFDKLKGDLSRAGQQWLEKTKALLQSKMEAGLRSGQWDEARPEELKKKAYRSHSEAYLEAGLADLPQMDIDMIIAAIDAADMWDKDAFIESIEVARVIYQKHGVSKALRTIGSGAGHMISQKSDAYDELHEMVINP